MRATEQAEADPQRNPVGSEYTIEGYIIGDNTTNKGYPLVATVVVTNNKWDTPNCHPVANPLKLTIGTLISRLCCRGISLSNFITIAIHTDCLPMAIPWLMAGIRQQQSLKVMAQVTI